MSSVRRASRLPAILLFGLATSAPAQEPVSLHHGGTALVAMSPDRRFLATLGSAIRLSEPQPRRLLHSLTSFDEHYSAAGFSANGAAFAALGEDEGLRVWDVASGQERMRVPALTGSACAVGTTPSSVWAVRRK